MFPSTEDFKEIITIVLRTAQAYETDFKILSAKEIHSFIGGYPGTNHRIPNCCNAMRQIMIAGDENIGSPQDGANFMIKYKLPRF
jgi:hypothetical protein